MFELEGEKMKMRRFVRAAVLAASAALAVSASSAVLAQEASNAGITLTYGLGSTWDNLNPYNVSTLYSIAVANKIFDQLAYTDANHDVKPRAAESWEMEDDGYSIVLHLREDAKWHDGEPVTAQDWVFTFNLMADPEVTGSTTSYLAAIEGIDGSGNKEEGAEIGVEARDDYTLVIHLDNPTYPEEFLTSYARFYYSVLPEHLLSDVAPADLMTDEFWSHPVGSGPFMFESEVAGEVLTLKAFNDFYLGAPGAETLIYKKVDTANMLTAMAAGELDATYPGITADEAAAIDGLYDNIKVETSQDTTFYGIFNNNERLNTDLRRAIDRAIDKQLLVDQLALGEGYVADTCVSKASVYKNTDVKFERDLDAAKKFLEDSGYDTSKPLKMAVVAGIRERIAAVIQQNLKEIGLDIEITTTDSASMFAGLKDGTYDLIIFTTPYSYLPTFFKNYVDPNAAYGTRATTTAYFDAFLDMQSEQDEEKRIEKCKELQAFLADEVPFLGLYEENVIMIRSARSEGITSVGTDEGWLWTAND